MLNNTSMLGNLYLHAGGDKGGYKSVHQSYLYACEDCVTRWPWSTESLVISLGGWKLLEIQHLSQGTSPLLHSFTYISAGGIPAFDILVL